MTANGIKPQPSKMNAIRDFPIPSNESELRSFIGIAEYAAHRFIPNFSILAAPLYDMLKQKVFTWSAHCNEVFLRLKDAVENIKTLQYFDLRKEITIRTDASGTGLGAVMIQEGRPILFASRKLTDTEKHYSQLEFLAV